MILWDAGCSLMCFLQILERFQASCRDCLSLHSKGMLRLGNEPARGGDESISSFPLGIHSPAAAVVPCERGLLLLHDGQVLPRHG